MMNAMPVINSSGVVQPGSLKATLFPFTSRYYSVGTAMLATASEKPTVYLRRRFVPPPEKFALLQEHRVAEGDRLDNIAAHYLGDPEQFWRICDANRAMNPFDLARQPQAIDRTLRITLPEGIPGLPYA